MHVYDDDDNKITLPTRTVACWYCDGAGRISNPAIDGNGISADEWAEWDDESQDDYLSGRWDVPCPDCEGRRTVEVPDEARCSADELARYQADLDDAAEQAAERAAELAAGC